MPKTKTLEQQACPQAFQRALDALDVIGRWNWDAATDLVQVDAFTALVYNVDPADAEEGVPLTVFIDGIHADDRDRVLAMIRRSARENSTYLIEHRVTSADGQTRWVLARGRFGSDHEGRPSGGSGILVDITRLRIGEDTCPETDAGLDETPLDRAVDHAIAAQQAILELQDPRLRTLANALLMELGRRLAQREIQTQCERMN
jgi:hypothetical protein